MITLIGIIIEKVIPLIFGFYMGVGIFRVFFMRRGIRKIQKDHDLNLLWSFLLLILFWPWAGWSMIRLENSIAYWREPNNNEKKR